MENFNNKNENLIEIRNLRFKFGDRWIFNGVDIDIARGKITAFMGPSGTGKTTLLRLIGGQLYPESGSIKLNGKNIPELNRTDLFSVRREMGMLFQSGALFTDLSVYENVVQYSMRCNKAGEWKLHNLIIEGINLGLTYRSQFSCAFQSMFQRVGALLTISATYNFKSTSTVIMMR